MASSGRGHRRGGCAPEGRSSGAGKVPRWRYAATETGFVVEERWEQDGKDWYSREMARADASQGTISALSVCCTGDWDAEHRARHAASVELLRP